MHFRVSVRAVSDAGTSIYWGWNYLEASELKANFWSKHPSSFDLKETTSNGKYYFSASPNQSSSSRLVGNADKYSWRFSVAPAGSDFAKYSYDSKGVEVASTSVNSILEDDLYLSLEKFQSSFPAGGAVLIMVHGTANGIETFDSRGSGIYFPTQDLLKYIDDTKKSIAAAKAAAELKAKQEAEAKAAAELKAKQDAEAKAAAEKAAAELKAKQEAEAKAAAELKAKQEAEAAAEKAAAELKAKQEAETKAAADKAAVEQRAKQEAEAVAKAAAELKAKQEAEAKAAASKKTTISCVKGKLVKKVTGVGPKCPAGYKLKR
jgi:Tfp pilus assembly protein FimV